MKYLMRILLVNCVLASLSTSASASVFESNNTPGYIKKVVMRSVVDCPGYYTAFTCEHYLNYGQSMAYEDFVSYNGEVTCYYTYNLDSITWIPNALDESVTTNSGFTGPYTGDNPIGSKFSYSYAASEPPITGSTPLEASNAIATRIQQLTGQPVSDWQRNRIYLNGCPDVARVFSKTTDGKYLPSEYPERSINPRWSIKAYSSYAQAQASSCWGERTLIFAIEGAWVGSPPVPSSTGEVPVASVDPANYIVRVPGNENKWINVSHGNDREEPQPQTLHVYNGPPPENFPNVRMIFVRICIHD